MELDLYTSPGLTFFLFIIALFRIFLEISPWKLENLPISRRAGVLLGQDRIKSFHRFGLYMGIGYSILFLPSIIQYLT